MLKLVSASACGRDICGIDLVSVILDKHHWMMYFLTPAMYPRFLITLDDKLQNKAVTVRVGQVSFSVKLDVTNSHTILRLLMLLVRQESPGRSRASRRINPLSV